MAGHIEDRWTRKDKTRTPIYGKGLRWRVIWTDDAGTRSSESFRSKDAARAHLTKLEHNHLTGDMVTREVRDRRLAHYWARYEPRINGLSGSAQSRTRKAWGRIQEEFGGKPLRVIRASAVNTWLAGMISDRGAPAGVATKRAAAQLLTALLGMAIEDGVIRTNPAVGAVVTGKREREHVYLTPNQLTALLEAVPAPWRLFTDVLASTGMRVGEAVLLDAGCLDTVRWRFEVYAPKTDTTRTVPVPPHLRADLEHLANTRNTGGPLFVTPSGSPVRPDNYRTRIFTPAARKIKLPERATVHDLRHTFASNLIAAGVNVKTVQEILGHASPVITLDVYAGVFDEDVDDAGAAISRRYGRS